MHPVIEVRDVYKSFKTVDAVRGVDLAIHPGQFVALLGPNGAGKTTLVEMIEGIQHPDRGDIFVMGKPWKGNEDELHRAIGLSLQETRFIDKLTVKETLRLFASFYDLDGDRVSEILATVGLAEKQDAYTVNLSGGQRQRLALGIALLNRPRILLLDEPTTGLDPNARREIWSILLDLKARGKTSLLLTTHYMEEAEQLCDYIMILDHGKVLQEGTLDQLLEAKTGEKIIEFALEESGSSIHRFASDSPFPIHWDPRNGRASIAIAHIESELPKFLRFLESHRAQLKTMECRRKTLDDLFTVLTGRRLSE